jgi:hypothetical protein
LKRALPRLVLGAVTGLTLVAVFGVLGPWSAGSERSLAGVVARLYRETVRGEALTRRDEAIRRCLEGKTQITNELLAGRLTLLQAAEAFRDCDDKVKNSNEAGVGTYRIAEDEEAVCRNVLIWATRAAARRGPQYQVVVRRLEDELRQFQSVRTRLSAIPLAS